MERNKVKIAFEFGIFSVFFLSAVILLITNFIVRTLTVLTMSNINYITDVPIIVEPILVVLSGMCFVISIIALIKSVLLLKKQ